MKIRNISNKVIGVNNVQLMPDDERRFSKEVASVPGVKILENLGYIKIIADEEKPVEKAEKKVEKKAEKKVEAKVEEVKTEEEPKAEEAPKKKTTKKKKTEEAVKAE